MKIYNLRISRSIGVSTAALLAIVFYIALNIVLNLSQNVIDPTGENYSEVFGIAQFTIVSLYWILINYFYFSRPGKSGPGTVFVYLLFMLLPIILFTTATCVIIEIYPTTEFVLSWNLMTWVAGPTLFWYLPYSYLYYVFGYTMPISTFLLICLIYNICIIGIGVILGLIRRSYSVEKAQPRTSAYRRQAVAFDSRVEAEMVTNLSGEEETGQKIDLDETIPTSIRDMEGTEQINLEIDRINNQETYAFEEDEELVIREKTNNG